jgi:hypothetical protein
MQLRCTGRGAVLVGIGAVVTFQGLGGSALNTWSAGPAGPVDLTAAWRAHPASSAVGRPRPARRCDRLALRPTHASHGHSREYRLAMVESATASTRIPPLKTNCQKVGVPSKTAAKESSRYPSPALRRAVNGALPGAGADHRGRLGIDQLLIQVLGRHPDPVGDVGVLQRREQVEQVEQGRLVHSHRAMCPPVSSLVRSHRPSHDGLLRRGHHDEQDRELHHPGTSPADTQWRTHARNAVPKSVS